MCKIALYVHLQHRLLYVSAKRIFFGGAVSSSGAFIFLPYIMYRASRLYTSKEIERKDGEVVTASKVVATVTGVCIW
jgi:hypothetical protein